MKKTKKRKTPSKTNGRRNTQPEEVRALFGNKGVRKPRWGEQVLKYKVRGLTDEMTDIEFLLRFYPEFPNHRIASILGRSIISVTSKAHTLRLGKSKKYLSERGKRNISSRYEGRRAG